MSHPTSVVISVQFHPNPLLELIKVSNYSNVSITLKHLSSRQSFEMTSGDLSFYLEDRRRRYRYHKKTFDYNFSSSFDNN